MTKPKKVRKSTKARGSTQRETRTAQPAHRVEATRSTTTSQATRSGDATSAERRGSRTRKATRLERSGSECLSALREEDLARAALALLPMFSVVDAVFTEDDAFEPQAKDYGFGRIYEAWKKVVKEMDPDFNAKRERRRHEHQTRSTRRR